MSVGLRSALIAVFKVPTLEMCQIRGVGNLPAEIFDMVANLRKLALFRTSVNTDHSQSEQPGDPAQPHAKTQLESLDLRDIHMMEQGGIFETMRSAMDFSRLRNVCVFSDTPDIVWEAIKDSSGSLEIFSWSHKLGLYNHTNRDVADTPFRPGEINLACLPNLRIFRFGFILFSTSEIDPLQWVLQSLKDITLAVGSGTSALEEITIYMGYATREDGDLVKLRDHDAWKGLSSLLTASTWFPKLRRVNLDIWQPPDTYTLERVLGTPSIEELFFGLLPDLRKNGILEVRPVSSLFFRDGWTKRLQEPRW